MKKLILFLAFTACTVINCTETFREKINFNLDKQVATPRPVQVRNKCVGNVDISTHDQNTIEIDILKESTTKEHLQKLEVKIENSDQKFSIEAINNNQENRSWFEWFDFNSRSVNGKSDKIDLKIKIPKSCTVDVDTNNGNIYLKNIDKSINIKSNLGSIDIDKARDSISIESNNGKLNLRDIKGPLKIRSNLGNVKLDDIHNGLNAKVTTGDVDIHNASGPLNVSVTTGSINLHQNKIQDSGEIDFDTTVGSINLNLPSTQDAILSAKTTVGPIDLNNKKMCSRFMVGNSFKGPLISNPQSKLKIFLRTTTGAISVSHSKL